MDKIQELHQQAFIDTHLTFEEIPAHATITEDLMGRFKRWCDNEAWFIHAYKEDKFFSAKTREEASFTELIQLFKETL